MPVPPRPAPMAPTPRDALDSALATLRANADRFAKLGPRDYLRLLQTFRDGYKATAEEQVRLACGAKRIDFDASVSGEEFLGGPMTVLRNIRLTMATLESIAETGHPPLPADKRLPNGRRAVRVFPGELKDKLTLGGFEADVWLEPGQEGGSLADHMAEFYRNPPEKGHVSLVLGAGNVNSIAPMDALYKMFTERRVVIIKMNPVNEYVGPVIERAFKAAIDEGFLRVVYGGGDVGAYLCYHGEVDDVHITGSDITHDLIVWGPPGAERERRKAAGDPLLKKPITSELGNVSPVMIVPGAYTDEELRFISENVATQVTNNGGFNCNAGKLIITASGWAQRDRFFDLLKEVLATIPPRVAYYPGAPERHAAWREGHDADLIGQPREEGALPWALIRDIDPKAKGDKCLSQEAFCGIIAETSLPANDAVSFIEQMIPFANDVVWGTLNCCILVDPRTEKKSDVAAALDVAREKLRFGAVVINHWPAVAYGFVTTPWGGHAGATLQDVQSGIGWVHNSFMLDRPQKTIIRGPLVVKPKPPWFRTHRNCNGVARALVDFEHSGSWFALPGVVLNALKG